MPIFKQPEPVYHDLWVAKQMVKDGWFMRHHEHPGSHFMLGRDGRLMVYYAHLGEVLEIHESFMDALGLWGWEVVPPAGTDTKVKKISFAESAVDAVTSVPRFLGAAVSTLTSELRLSLGGGLCALKTTACLGGALVFVLLATLAIILTAGWTIYFGLKAFGVEL